MDLGAVAAGSRHQLARVVAVRAADHDDDVALLREFHCGVLTLLRRLADRIHKAHFGSGEALAHQLHQCAHARNGLRGLGHDAEARTLGQLRHIFRRQHDIERIEVFRHAPHFHVIAFADNDGVKALRHQLRQRAMCDVNERTGGLHYIQSARARLA